MMKTKTIILSALLFTGCALDGELFLDDGSVGILVDPIVEPCLSCDPSLDIQVRWNIDHQRWPNCGDLDLELVTPSGNKVTDTHFDVDGCLHFGNDLGAGGFGNEEIICDFPDFGHYDIRVINHSEADASASLSVDFGSQGFTRDFVMTGFELKTFGISIR